MMEIFLLNCAIAYIAMISQRMLLECALDETTCSRAVALEGIRAVAEDIGERLERRTLGDVMHGHRVSEALHGRTLNAGCVEALRYHKLHSTFAQRLFEGCEK